MSRTSFKLAPTIGALTSSSVLSEYVIPIVVSDQYATLDLGSTAAHAESPTDEAEAMTEVEGSSTLESAGSIPDYLGRLSEKYAVLSQEDLAFK